MFAVQVVRSGDLVGLAMSPVNAWGPLAIVKGATEGPQSNVQMKFVTDSCVTST